MQSGGRRQEDPFANSLLRGPADIWWRSLERLEDDNKIITRDTFKSKLEARFKHKNAHGEARNRLANLKQKATVQTYIDPFHTIHLQRPDITEDELLDRFIRSQTGGANACPWSRSLLVVSGRTSSLGL